MDYLTKKPKEDAEVTINIPFTYNIGDVGFYTDKTLETVQDCVEEVKAEINSGLFKNNDFSYEVDIENN